MKYGLSLLPVEMLDDEPVLRDLLTRRAVQSGYEVAADAEITSRVMTGALDAVYAGFAEITVTMST